MSFLKMQTSGSRSMHLQNLMVLAGAVTFVGFATLQTFLRGNFFPLRSENKKKELLLNREGKETRQLRDVAVFWDIENIQIPREVDPSCLGNAIQDLAREIGASKNLEFVNAYIDTQQLNTGHANILSQIGINLIHSPIAKEAADKAIIVDLLIWLLQYEKNRHSNGTPCVVLITRDHDFEPMLYKLRNIEHIHVVLVTELSRVKPHFINAANEAFDWQQIVERAMQRQRELGLEPPFERRYVSQVLTERARSGKNSGQVVREGRRERYRRMSSGGRIMSSYLSLGEDSDTEESDDETFYIPAEKAINKPYESFRQNRNKHSTRKKEKPFSSVISPCSSLDDEVADFVLRALQTNGRTLSTNTIYKLMKNPGTGGGYHLYNYAKQRDSSGRHILFSQIKKHKDRFEMFKSKKGVWLVKLVDGPHEYICAPYKQESGDEGNGSNGFEQDREKRKASKWKYEVKGEDEDKDEDEDALSDVSRE